MQLSGNQGGTNGGGMYFCGYDADSALLERSAIVGNGTGGVTAGTHAGGVAADCNGRMTINQSLIADNTVGLYGAGVWQHSSGAPNPADKITVINSTITGNKGTAGGSVGGGLWVEGRGELRNVTVADNSAEYGGGVAGADHVAASNVIVANNASTNQWGVQRSCGVRFASVAGGVVEWPARSNPGDPNNPPCADSALVLDPLLAPLASAGGPTQTMLLATSSGARGVGSGCEAVDQRGVTRGARCDPGAAQEP